MGDDTIGVTGPGGYGISAKGTVVVLLVAIGGAAGAIGYVMFREHELRSAEHRAIIQSIDAHAQSHTVALNHVRSQLAVRDCLDYMSTEQRAQVVSAARPPGTPYSAEEFLRTWCRWLGAY